VKHIGSILSGFALTVLLISCGKEPITLKYPKVIASGDMGKIEKFVNQYSDSLQNDSKTFFNIVLKIDNFRKIFYPVHNLQAKYFARWGTIGANFYLQWTSALFLIENWPLSIAPNALSILVQGINSSDPKISMISIHTILHLPEKDRKLLSASLLNYFNNNKVELPVPLYRLCRQIFNSDMPESIHIKRNLEYSAIQIDTLFASTNVNFESLAGLTALYQWDYFTRVDSSFTFSDSLIYHFRENLKQFGALYWRIFHFHRVYPLGLLISNEELNDIWSYPGSLQNEILIDMMDSEKVHSFGTIIGSWLSDSTITANQKQRILTYLQVGVPDALFDGLYMILDIDFLQTNALQKIAKIKGDKIDLLLEEKLTSGKTREIAKTIYVMGFRKKKSAIPFIRSYLDHENETIRFNARVALQRIDGQ